MSDLKKWQELKDCAALVCHALKGDLHRVNDLAGTPEEVEASARAQAAALARELFPPMAKPLPPLEKWERLENEELKSGNYVISYRRAFMGSEYIGIYKSNQEAWAACESHHQSKFKELLA